MVSVDMFHLIGFSLYTAFGLMTLYLVRLGVLTFLENTKGGAKLIPLFWVLSFFFVIAIVILGVV
ncbi:MAG: hypothetical protein COV47_04770 [Candidatus Diapherotrites archaeon CG11_big_fil_rev_8_21_14_0_20_37_9]|nr:MAG: hypothetical protein COV47_04770 [Candidatus Diapherotrites archaeon CG11_big_fil_rev_8_21_14_0_20_37_9]